LPLTISMKHPFLIICLLLLGSIFSCTKEKSDHPDQFPVWLQAKIMEITSENDLCKYTHIEIIKFEGKFYYNIRCDVWNCIYCQVFDEQGNKIQWNSETLNIFLANNEVIKTLPACQ